MINHEDGQVSYIGNFSNASDFYSRTSLPSNLSQYNKSQLHPRVQGGAIKANPSGISHASMYQEPHNNVPDILTNMDQKGYFFDSPSKYISLKDYKKTHNMESKPPTNAAQYKAKASGAPLSGDDLKIRDWFENLSHQEKSIVLTVVDKQLVGLIFQMYKVYEQEPHIKFFNRHPSSFSDPQNLEKVKNYPLWYKKRPRIPSGYQYDSNFNYLRQIENGEDQLINHIRLLNLIDPPPIFNKDATQTGKKKAIQQNSAAKKSPQIQALINQERNKIGGSSYIQEFDTLTLDISMYDNCHYFFEVLKCLNGNTNSFLQSQFEMSHDLKRLDHSVFYQENENGTAKNPKPQTFSTLVPVYWGYPGQTKIIYPEDAENNKDITLGQCLALIFEKAINVQYYEHISKLNPKEKHYFFIKDIPNNVFENDQILSDQWANMSFQEKEALIQTHLQEVEAEMRQDEHRPVKAAVLGSSAVALASRLQEDNNRGGLLNTSVFDEEDEDRNESDGSEEGGGMSHHNLRKANERMTGIFLKGDEDPYQRTRGFTSAQCKVGSHIQAAKRSRDFYGDNDSNQSSQDSDGIIGDVLDERAYDRQGAPIMQGGGQGAYDSDQSDEEELADIEKLGTRVQQNRLKPGAVGKLKNKIYDSRSKFAPKTASNLSVQESEEHYSNEEFESDEEYHEVALRGRADSSTYFMDDDHRYDCARQVTTITKVMTNQMVESLENPLMLTNKFFFIKSQFRKLLTPSEDKIEAYSFKFFKNLSTFISLPIALVASQSIICTNSSRMESFNRGQQYPHKDKDYDNPMLGAQSIPIKQRLYARILHFVKNWGWDELMSQDDNKAQKAASNIVKANQKLALEVQKTFGTPPPAAIKAIEAESKVNTKKGAKESSSVVGKGTVKQPPQLDILAQNQFSKKPSLPAKAPVQLQEIPTQKAEKTPLFPKTEPKKSEIEKVQTQQVAATPPADPTENKASTSKTNKKKKKKEKQKAQKLAAAAALAQQANEAPPSKDETNGRRPSVDSDVVNQIKQEAQSVEIIKKIMASSTQKAALLQQQDACTFTLINPIIKPLDIDNNRFPSLATHTQSMTFSDSNLFTEDERYIGERTSLMHNRFEPTKYPDQTQLERIRQREALSSFENEILSMKRQITDANNNSRPDAISINPSLDASAHLLLDPTLIPDRSVIKSHQRVIQNIVYGATKHLEQSDEEMRDESEAASAMDAKYTVQPQEGEQGGGNKKKKRNKKKKSKKKNKNEETKGEEACVESKDGAKPVEIEMIELNINKKDVKRDLSVEEEVKDEEGGLLHTPIKREIIDFNFEGSINLSHHFGRKSGSINTSSPMIHSLINTPSDVRRDIEEVRQIDALLGEECVQFENDETQRFINEKTSSLINTTLETIRQEEEEEDAALLLERRGDHGSPENTRLDPSNNNDMEVTEVTQVIDLKKEAAAQLNLMPKLNPAAAQQEEIKIKEIEIIAPSQSHNANAGKSKKGNQGSAGQGKKGGKKQQANQARLTQPTQPASNEEDAPNHQVVAGLTIIGGSQNKLSKKQQKNARQAAKKAQLAAEKKQAEEQPATAAAVMQEIEQYHKTKLEQNPLPKIDLLNQELNLIKTTAEQSPPKNVAQTFLSNENLLLLEKHNQQQREEEKLKTPDQKSEKSKKSVGFKVIAQTAPRQPSFFQFKAAPIAQGYHSSSAEDGQGLDDNVKIPKRGSSRGSSCTEEAIHQSTINMLGDLFPQQYKNPSDDTKLRISKITTSSSASNKGGDSASFSGSPDVHTKQKQGPTAVTSKFLEEPYPSLETAAALTHQNPKKRNKGGHHGAQGGMQNQRGPQNQSLNQASPREKYNAKREFDGYDAMFQEAYKNASKQLHNDDLIVEEVKSETPLEVIEEEKVPITAPLAIQVPPPQSSTPTPPQSEKIPVSNTNTNSKNKNKKVKPSAVAQDAPSAPTGSTSNLKEMKERGAIARPSDIEHAAKKGNQQSKKDRQKAQVTGPNNAQQDAPLIPPSVAMSIQRTQTPNASQPVENQLASSAQHGTKPGQNKNPKNCQPGNKHQQQTVQPNGQGRLNNINPQGAASSQGGVLNANTKRRNNQTLGGGNANNSNCVGSVPPLNNGNGNQLHRPSNITTVPPSTHNLASPPILPNPQGCLFDIQQQNQQLLDHTTQQFQLQQQQALFQQQLLNHQQSQLNTFGLMNNQLGASGGSTQNLFSHFQGAPGANFPQVNSFGLGTQFFDGAQGNHMGMPVGGHLGQGFTPDSSINQGYSVSSVQISALDESLLAQQQMMSQQTQTDEQANQQQAAISNQNQQAPFVFHQYHNINIGVHMPPVQPNGMGLGGAQSSYFGLPGVAQFMMPQTFMDPSAPFNPSQPPLLQQQYPGNLLHPLLGFNPLMAASQLGQTPSVPNQATLYGDLQQQLNLQNNLLLNPLMYNSLLQQQQHQTNPTGSLLGQTTLPTQMPQLSQHLLPHQMHNPHQLGRPNRLNSLPVGSTLGGHFGNNQVQMFLEMILQNNQTQNSLSDLGNAASGTIWPNNQGVSNSIPSSVSHMSQDQYEEQTFVGTNTEKFFAKMDQEIYKLQSKIKLKLLSIESERQSALRRIESSIKETYSECPSARVEMYGSMATGLAIDSSDMDLLVQGLFTNLQDPVVPTGGKNLFNMRLPDVVDRAILVETMKRFFRELTNMDSSNEGVRALKECLEDVKIIETASVPVIKLVIDLQKIRAAEFTAKQNPIEEDMRLLKIDITFDDSQNGGEFDFFSQGFQNSFGPPPTNIHMGIRCCQFVKKKLEEYSALESLTLVLKKFLALRNMNQPYQGGLNSYGLIILIVTFLNLQLADFYSKEGALSFARVLKGFLFYFGKQFDSNFNIISEQQQIVHEINYSSILVIRDPLNPLNNIGKSTFNFENIRAEFVKAHDEIERHLQEFILSQSPACIAVEEGAAQQIESLAAKGAEESQPVWKKKLDVLSKILTPHIMHSNSAHSLDGAGEGSPFKKMSPIEKHPRTHTDIPVTGNSGDGNDKTPSHSEEEE